MYQASNEEKCKQKKAMPRLYDSWGASEYLQKSTFKYVDDYLQRTNCLLNMSNSVQTNSFSSSYEVVSSTDDLFSEKISHNQSKNNDKTLLDIESESVKSLSQNSALCFNDNHSADLKNALLEKKTSELILHTHRPNSKILQIPVFDPQKPNILQSSILVEQDDSEVNSEKENLEAVTLSDVGYKNNEKRLTQRNLPHHTPLHHNEFHNQSMFFNKTNENNLSSVLEPIAHDKVLESKILSDAVKNQKTENKQLPSNNLIKPIEQVTPISNFPCIPSLNLESLQSDTENHQEAQKQPRSHIDKKNLLIQKRKSSEDTSYIIDVNPSIECESKKLNNLKLSFPKNLAESKNKPKTSFTKSTSTADSDKNFEVKTYSQVKLALPGIQSVARKHISIKKELANKMLKSTQQSLRGWFSMPDEVLLHIFSFLSVADLPNLGRVCKMFNRISNDSYLWKTVEVCDGQVNDRWLVEMGERSPKSVSLVRCNGTPVTNLGLRSFFKCCKTSLQELHVENCTGEYMSGDSVLLHASCHCRRLRRVNVAWSKMSDNGLIAIAVALPELSALNINGNSSVSDEAFHILTERHAKHLTSLEMSGCFAVSSEILLTFIQSTTNLEKVNLGLCSKLSSDAIINMCPNLRSLKQLDLRGIKSLTNECLRAIARHCESLQTLVVSNCSTLTDAGLAEVAALHNSLKHLDLSGCSQVTDSGVMNFVMSASVVEHLDLSGTGVTFKTVDLIAANNCSTLKSLKLSFCHNITFHCLAELLRAASSLKSLHVYGCKRIKLSQLIKVNNNVTIEK